MEFTKLGKKESINFTLRPAANHRNSETQGVEKIHRFGIPVYHWMWSTQYHKPTIWDGVLFVVILSYSGDPSFANYHFSVCHMVVSWNRDTPKSSILMGFPL